MNQLVMNFLIIEGYKEGAEKFSKESGLPVLLDEKIDERIKIRKYIQSGQIKDAIDEINKTNSELLEKDQDLLFELKKQ